jgi:hypothetical protein
MEAAATIYLTHMAKGDITLRYASEAASGTQAPAPGLYQLQGACTCDVRARTKDLLGESVYIQALLCHLARPAPPALSGMPKEPHIHVPAHTHMHIHVHTCVLVMIRDTKHCILLISYQGCSFVAVAQRCAADARRPSVSIESRARSTGPSMHAPARAQQYAFVPPCHKIIAATAVTCELSTATYKPQHTWPCLQA